MAKATFNENIIGGLNSVITSVWDSMPDVVKNFMPEKPAIDEIELTPIPTKHDGGALIGPAKIRNDEYVIIPPKGAPAGDVLTPKQASNSGQQPMEMVINIDGREFVRQTVIPTLNKQFNLQGIG